MGRIDCWIAWLSSFWMCKAEERRSGAASTLSGSEQRQRLTMEEIFLAILGEGSQRDSKQELSWLA